MVSVSLEYTNKKKLVNNFTFSELSEVIRGSKNGSKLASLVGVLRKRSERSSSENGRYLIIGITYYIRWTHRDSYGSFLQVPTVQCAWWFPFTAKLSINLPSHIHIFSSASTNWLEINCRDTVFTWYLQCYPKIFSSILPLLYLYFTSTKPLLIIYYSSTILLTIYWLFTYLSRIYSQRGNILFPVWEHFMPNVGTILPLNGNYDSP